MGAETARSTTRQAWVLALVAVEAGFLGLGSNVGDRRANMQAAVDLLPEHGVRVQRSSSIYETEPVGEVLDQREFYNACIQVETALSPEALLAACKAVELRLGRDPDGIRHGPRPIDVDVLLLGQMTYSSRRLRLPHPETKSRRFVLVPLLELEPELKDPSGAAFSDALLALGSGQDVVLREPPLTVAS